MDEPPVTKADPFGSAYPGLMRTAESTLVGDRRAVADVHGPVGTAPTGTEAVGVAISGGGIRSATFALGVFQGLARFDLIRRIDYLSTVSGGGYFGAFLGRLFSRKHDPATAHEEVRKTLLGEQDRWVLNNLRENGRYLAPNGGADAFLGLSVIVRNLVSLQVVLIFSLFAAALVFACALDDLFHDHVGRCLAWFLGGRDLLKIYDHDWCSTWAIVPVVLFLFGVLPLGWAYWLPERRKNLVWVWVWCFPVALALAGLAALWGGGPIVVGRNLLLVGGATLAWCGVAFAYDMWCEGDRAARLQKREKLRASGEPRLAVRGARRLLSRWLSFFLLVTLVFVVVAVVDSVALAILDPSKHARPILGSIVAAGTAVAAWGKKIATIFGGTVGGKRVRIPVSLAAGAAAVVLVGAILVGIDVLATDLWWWWKADMAIPPFVLPVGAALAALALGQGWPFVNRSSHHEFYSECLTRAYLGASNQARSGGTGGVSNLVPGDDIRMGNYWGRNDSADLDDAQVSPPRNGGPLHLVNVTINETCGGRSGLEMRDQKGVGMAIGPAGASVGVRHHVVGDWSRPDEPKPPRRLPTFGGSEDYSVFGDKRDFKNLPPRSDVPPEEVSKFNASKMEDLTVGRWVGISGAAFSTGIGSQTSFGLSLLCGLANVRLGYWWKPGVKRHGRGKRFLAWFPVQWHLMNEFLARFPGTSKEHWYLSDGGHFENMGAYELLRRRMKRIVIVDAEADPNYTFEGLANLVRKARLDFNAEIAFLDEGALTRMVHPEHRRLFGALRDLARGGKPGAPNEDAVSQEPSRAHAALATIRYYDRIPDGGSIADAPVEGWILYIKTTVTGDEPVDVQRYQSSHPTFPHESTADQFFDEPQWESYRRLGESIGDALFRPCDGGGDPRWVPSDLLRLDRKTPGP